MNAPLNVQIDVGEDFPHLSRAPIVEAVIDVRALASEPMDEGQCRDVASPQMDGYGFLDSRRVYVARTEMKTGGPPSQNVRDLGWKGLRFRSVDGKHIVQFNRDGFVFSRLEPYVNWEQLMGEALKRWAVFKGIAKPVEVQRLGLRFVNRITLETGESGFEKYIHPTPTPPRGLDLPFRGFVHHETLAVPGYPYAVNVVRTIQPPVPGPDGRLAVIVDIDVFTDQRFEMDDGKLAERFSEMRWLKNKVFFGSITEASLARFK